MPINKKEQIIKIIKIALLPSIQKIVSKINQWYEIKVSADANTISLYYFLDLYGKLLKVLF